MSLTKLLLGGRFGGLSSFFSIAYMAAFLPLALIGFSIVPKRAKKYFLLIASYGFFWLISGKLLAYLLLSTMSIHYFGLWLARIQGKRDLAVKAVPREERKAVKAAYQRQMRGVLWLAVLLHIGGLLALKYTPFFAKNFNSLLTALNISFQLQIPKYALPIGISFFTLQAVSYILDVYRGTIPADDNLGRLALFMSFFPQIVEGPICRYSQTADALWNVGPIQYDNLRLGVWRILYGMLKKVVVADRLNAAVGIVFGNYASYSGGIIALAALMYTVQLYMDFFGSMDAVIGVGQILGVKMPENFLRPFFSRNISEFWKRWHATLGTWFKDYVFYPVTMSGPMKRLTSSARKKLGNHFGPLIAGGIALFLVWFFNGLWHGAAWNYILFGMYHFVLILSASLFAPLTQKVNKALRIRPESRGFAVFQMLRTGILVVIGEMFFRAEGLRACGGMLSRLIAKFEFTPLNAEMLKSLHLDAQDLIITGITLLIVLAVSILNERGIAVREWLKKRRTVVRWAILYAMILYIVLFGAYGKNYLPVDPMYAFF